MVDPSDDPRAPYWLALGEFVHRYASIEQTIHQILRIVFNTTDIDAKVLFSGTRVSGATDFIKRYYTARKKPLPSDLEKAFERIGIVTKARDRILHNGLDLHGDLALVTDEEKNISSRAFKHIVSVEDLENLAFDAIIVNSCLVCFWIETRRGDLIGSVAHQYWRAHADAPWRYKQPKPMKIRDRIRGTVRERRVRPQPSQG